MIVQITENVRLRVESGETLIEKRLVAETGKKAGEERWVVVGSYVGLEQAAGILLNRHVALLGGSLDAVFSLGELCGVLVEAGDKIAAALKAATPSEGA